jgi:Reverse transcriptase (RNA-dependent DNA polymerase)
LRKVPTCPDNAYGKCRHPTDIEKGIRQTCTWKDMTRSEPGSSRTQQPSEQPPADNAAPPGALSEHSPHNSDEDKVEDILCLQREGGVQFLNHLLAKAVPSDSESPDSANVCEWTFRDIHKMLSDTQKEWKAACCEELESLRRCNVFKLVDPPKDRTIIRNRWVFDLKSDGCKKARLVAKGFFQIEGIDYDKIFSLVVQFETVRMMIAIVALKKWHIQGLDIKTTFLYGELDEELYMEQPKGFKVKGQEGKVTRLKHATYGLKQAALAWWKALDKSMAQLGFTRLLSDSGIFISKDKSIVAIVYVDDVLFLGPNKKDLLCVKEEFMKKWECRDLGEAKEFLHMRIQHKNGRIYLDQTAYLQKVL